MDKDLPPNIKFWLDGPEHDCFFVVGPESGPTERIGALKIFLKGHSEPMRVMFGEGATAERGDIRVVDVEPETFKIFLKCIYGGSDLIIPQLPFEVSAKLLYVAEKYLVSDVKNRTVKHLSNLLSLKNILTSISHKVCRQEDTLKTSILQILRNNSKEIFSYEEFVGLNGSDLLWILQQEDINIREIEIWNAVLKWARRKCQKGESVRSQMLPVLGYVRFLTMEFKEFCRDVVPSNVLNKEEISELCKSFGTGVSPSMSNLCRIKTPRNSFAVSEKLLVASLETTSNSMTMFCTINNVTDLQDLEESQSLEWSKCYWSTFAHKNLQDGKICLFVGFYCKTESKYKVVVRHELIFINKKGRHPNVIESSTHEHKEGQTGFGYNQRMGQLKHFGVINGDSLSFVVNVELLEKCKC